MRKMMKVITWLFIGLSVVFFWLSLRMTEDNLEYTLYAAAMIAIAFGANFLLKKYEKEEKERE
ncbi:MAG: hypothetical protein JXR10_10565 [Cyclobacteriaceae bacterium]